MTMQPGFLFGGNTGLSYDQLQRRKKIAESMLARSTARTPRNVGEGLTALGQALGGAIRLKRIENQEATARDKFGSEAASVIGDYMAGGSSPTEAAPSSAGYDPNVSSPETEGVESYIRQSATQKGVDPETALKVARSEGLAPGVWQSNVSKGGRREPSYGPFQLLVGGEGTGFPTGLGNAFMEQTGLDPRDQSTVNAQIDFSLDQAKKGGWSPWYGAAKVGVDQWDGLRGNSQKRTIRNSVEDAFDAAGVVDADPPPKPIQMASPETTPVATQTPVRTAPASSAAPATPEQLVAALGSRYGSQQLANADPNVGILPALTGGNSNPDAKNRNFPPAPALGSLARVSPGFSSTASADGPGMAPSSAGNMQFASANSQPDFRTALGNDGLTPATGSHRVTREEAEQRIAQSGSGEGYFPPAPPAPGQGAPARGVDPRILGLMDNPYLSSGQKAVLGAIMQRQLGQMFPDERKQLELQKLRRDVAKRDTFQDVNKRTRYLDSGELVAPDLEVEPEQTALQQNYNVAVDQGYAGTIMDYQQDLKKAGASQTNITVGGKEQDKDFASRMNDWTLGGSADAAKQIAQIESVITVLEGGADNVTGPVLGAMPDWLRAGTHPKSQAMKDRVEEVLQRSLRAILGAQFTEKEGAQLIKRGYNSSLSETENAKRLNALVTQLKAMKDAQDGAAGYFSQHGTIQGWQGRLPTISDFAVFGDEAGDDETGDAPSAGDVQDGYRFKGGDPGEANNWEKYGWQGGGQGSRSERVLGPGIRNA
ncbi:MAG: hypothetical protein GY807_21820, partial [Gammaproteobacteria bacterium]|nr:hypothetical protein [Gammaproteobacteria bacterium]